MQGDIGVVVARGADWFVFGADLGGRRGKENARPDMMDILSSEISSRHYYIVRDAIMIFRDLQVKENSIMEVFFLISCDQMRDARALLRWSIREFSEKSGVSTATIERLENGRYEMGEAKINTMKSIIKTLEAGGIEFLPDDSVRRRQG